jgi:hypothetical protein
VFPGEYPQVAGEAAQHERPYCEADELQGCSSNAADEKFLWVTAGGCGWRRKFGKGIKGVANDNGHERRDPSRENRRNYRRNEEKQPLVS